jgi:hypothetical protein
VEEEQEVSSPNGGSFDGHGGGHWPQQQQQPQPAQDHHRLMASLKVESLHTEIEFLRSRVRELESSNAEKDKQLRLQRSQLSNLRRRIEVYEEAPKYQSQAGMK